MALTKVSTDGVKDDAITKTKIPANQIEASELADNAVDTNAIANNAVTAGKLASGVQTTINNNADNRVITGSGTANTLEGEANLTYNGTDLQLTTDANNEGIKIDGGTTYPVFEINANRSAGNTLGKVISKWNGTQIASINFVSGSDGTNKDDGYMAFSTSSAANISERMRIDSSGNVGIGTGSNAIQANLHVEAAVPVIRMKDSDNNSAVQFVGQDGSIRYDADNDNIAADSHHAFKTDNVERVRIQAEGLTFNGDTAAANALDDYEEGTFTPVMKFGGGNTGMSIGSVEAIYTKIGRMVYATIRFTMTGKGSDTGQLTFTGLPFTVGDVLSSTSVQGGFDLQYLGGNVNAHEIKAYPWEATSLMKVFKRSNQNSTVTTFEDSDITGQNNTFDGRISFFYTT